MPSADHPGGNAPLHGRRQPRADRVGDLRPGAFDPAGELLLGTAEVLEHLLVRGGLFEWVQLSAMQVLQEGVAKQFVICRFAYDRRDRLDVPVARLASDVRP